MECPAWRWFRGALAAAVLCSLPAAGGCGSSSGGQPVETQQQLTAKVNKRVTVQGVAARFGNRPIVRNSSFWAYVMNANAWPEEVMG